MVVSISGSEQMATRYDGLMHSRRQMLNAQRILWVGLVLAGAAVLVPVHGQTGRGAVPELTAQDRVELQDLVTRYARALGSCAAEEYADLFAPGGGYFFSSIRGEV